MAGKFTHLRYDHDAYVEELARSTNPLNYRLNPNYAVNCNKCFAPYGPRGGQDAADAVGHQIDVDSVLRGISKIHTKSNQQQMPDSLNHFHNYMRNDCPEMRETEYSRYTTPSYDLKGLTVRDSRFDYPLYDPQCQIFENFEINTRLQAKDNHRAIWQVPFDQSDLLPTRRLGKVRQGKNDLNYNYASYDRVSNNNASYDRVSNNNNKN